MNIKLSFIWNYNQYHIHKNKFNNAIFKVFIFKILCYLDLHFIGHALSRLAILIILLKDLGFFLKMKISNTSSLLKNSNSNKNY